LNSFKIIRRNKICILTNRPILSDTLINFLSFSPKYIPSTNISFYVGLSYINDFIRRLQWFYFFRFKEKNDTRFTHRNTNKWVNSALLPSFIIKLSEDIISIYAKLYRTSESDLTDLLNITDKLNNDNIIIIPADKGNNWVIMDKHNYINEGLSQLSDSRFYNSIPTSRANYTKKHINHYLYYMKHYKYISRAEYRSLMVEDFKTRRMYLLPKIHKEKWPNLATPPCRPIISNQSTETHTACLIIDHFLKPLCKDHFTYVKDSSHFITKIHNTKINDNHLLFTLDITSLYTNIPTQGAIEVVKSTLSKYPDKNRPDNFIIKLLNLILSRNDFSFNGNTYTQSSGLNMGSHFSPTVAILYMNYFEDTFFRCNHKPLLWLRYIDDVFGIWDINQDFTIFLNNLNQHNDSIHFTGVLPNTSVNFLDLTIYKNNNYLFYKPYFKPTHNFNILSSNSCHPPHIFKSIISNEIRRLAFNSSLETDFSNIFNSVKQYWYINGYTRTFIRNTKNAFLNKFNLNNCWRFGSFPCNNCSLCPLHIKTISFKTFRILGNFSCNTNNSIYCIHCTNCKKSYIGQTENTFRRMNAHILAIKNKDNRLVHHHFHASCSLKDFSFFIISIENDEKIRLIKESNYIKKFDTKYPNGLNVIKNTKLNDKKLNFIIPYNDNTLYIANSIKHLCKKSNIDLRLCFKNNKNLLNHFRNY